MVNYCVCGACKNSSLSGHRVHRFPNKKKDGAIFRAWVRFVQVKRRDFSSASASINAVVCSFHFRPEDYRPGDMMEFNMGYRSKNRVRLRAGAVPSVHASSGSPAGGKHAPRRKRKLCTDLAEIASNEGGATPSASAAVFDADPEQEPFSPLAPQSSVHHFGSQCDLRPSHRSSDCLTKTPGEATEIHVTHYYIKMPFIKEESKEMRIQEVFSVKQEDTEEPTTMAFIKEESEDMKIEGAFRVKQEDTEEQTDLMTLKEESQELNEMENKCHDFTTEEKSFIHSQTHKTENRNVEFNMRVHSGEKPFICPQCGKSFRLKKNLNTHMRIHTGEKPFTCPQCGKSFGQKNTLDSHMRTHTGESPYTCQQCGKSFSLKGNLNAHMRIHTGEKPFTCPQCGKSFKQKNNLDSHMRIHTGESPYTCQQCGKIFSRKNGFKTHMTIHTGEKPFICQCGKSFGRKDSLNQHMRIHSKDKSFIKLNT